MSIANRIQDIISHYTLSASGFADKVGVPRSSISHILSERNKPSLDFIIKTMNAFPEVDLYWLLNGKGGFPPTDNITTTVDRNSEPDQSAAPKQLTQQKLEASPNRKQIARILICYTDGTFESFHEN